MMRLALLLALAAPSASDGPLATIRLLEGGTLAGRLEGIREDRVLLSAEGRVDHDPRLEAIEAIELHAPGTTPARGPALHLATGDWFPVERIQAGPNGGLRAEFHGQVLEEILLDRIRGARFLASPPEGDELSEALSGPPPGGRDLVFVITASGPLKLAATLLKLDGQELLLEVGELRQRLPLSRLQGLVLASSRRETPFRPAPAEGLLDGGGRLRGSILGADSEALSLDHPLLGTVRIPWAALTTLLCSRDRVLDLAQASFLADEAVAAFDRVWPVARNRTLEGNPIVLGDMEHRTGLCFLPRRSLSFAIPVGFTRFQAVLGFAREAGGTGRARFRVLADGGILLDRMLSGSEPPLPIALDLGGAEVLTLEVDFGPLLHLGNHCLFASPRLLAPPRRN